MKCKLIILIPISRGIEISVYKFQYTNNFVTRINKAKKIFFI